MIRSCMTGLAALMALGVTAQSYTSYFTGNTVDSPAQPAGGVCMMGGATEHDGAMAWFLQRANGGDVLVLRASGSNGYNDYMYSELGGINSVETIVFNNASAANDPYVLERIDKAEAIWFAGGDQWNYVSYWRNTPVAEHINQALAQRNIAIGGTSAGMAILGGHYFSAEQGSVTSSTALANPYANAVTASNDPFLQVPYMAHVITDTHYDNPDRRGRHTVFLARMVVDSGVRAFGIACNEYVAVTIDPEGIAKVWGDWPNYSEYAFFLQANCADPMGPEVCSPGQPLTWVRDGAAVKVYKVPGLMQGGNWFDLNDWETGSGGSWEHWTVQAGSFMVLGGTAADCDLTTAVATPEEPFLVTWDRERGLVQVQGLPVGALIDVLMVDGRKLPSSVATTTGVHLVSFPSNYRGTLMLQAIWPQGRRVWRSGF